MRGEVSAQNVDNGVYECVGAGGIWEIFVLSAQFIVNLKLLFLKKKKV